MRWRWQWWHFAGLAGLGALAFWKGPEVIAVARDFVTRGKRLTHSPRLNADGQVPAAPLDLLAEAQATLGREISLDAYTLARMARAEGGAGPPEEKAARMWVAINDGREHGWDLLRTVAGPDGLYGRQRGWRYASGRDERSDTMDPFEDDLNIAEAVLAGELPDPTGAALKFVDLDKHDPTALEGQGPGSYDPKLLESWGREGLAPDMVAGARGTFRIFRRVG